MKGGEGGGEERGGEGGGRGGEGREENITKPYWGIR